MKQAWKPGTVVYPLPAVLVSCGATPDEYNLVTVAWTGTVCTSPPMCYISLRPERHSYGIIRRTGEFVINLTTERMARAVDWCGVKSGRDCDKFRETGLTPAPAAAVAAPIVAEAPVSIECRVKQILPLGSHDMFLAEVVGVQVDERYVDAASGRFEMERAGLIAYSHGEYFTLGEAIGRFGWSVRRKKAAKADAPGRRTARTPAHAHRPDETAALIFRPGYSFAAERLRDHSSASNPTSTRSSVTSSGRLTSLPSEASSAISSSSDAVRMRSFSPSSR